jgi:hypothetical protein
MSEVKIARAWGAVSDEGDQFPWAHHSPNAEAGFDIPVLIVHGLTEPELRELLERRGECEWYRCPCEGSEYETWNHDGAVICGEAPDFCPSCGRRVVVNG